MTAIMRQEGIYRIVDGYSYGTLGWLKNSSTIDTFYTRNVSFTH